MATSPDVRKYVDLTVYDRDPHELVTRALQYLAVYLPSYVPRSGNTEVALLEAMGMQSVEMVYALNRLPGAVTQVLLKAGFGIPQDLGAPATATVTFTLADPLGHTVPAGTIVQLALGSPTIPALNFATTADLTMGPGIFTGTVAVQAVKNTDQANGIAIGTSVALFSQLPWVQSVALASSPTGGRTPEDGRTYLSRAAITLQRLTSTLVRPADFQTAAAATVGVYRVQTVNNWNGAPWNYLSADAASFETATGGWVAGTNTTIARSTAQSLDGAASLSLTATAAGNVTATSPVATATAVPVVVGLSYTGLVSVRGGTARSTFATLSWYNSAGTLLSTSAGTAANDSTTAWTQYSVTATAPGNAAYAAVGVEVDALAAGEVHYVDQAGVFLGTNTTWAIPGGGVSTPGYITVAVYGQGNVPLSTAAKAALQTTLQGMAQVNLTVKVVDPTVTPVPVAATVLRTPTMPAATAQANAVAAVKQYASTDTWPFLGTLSVSQLTAAIDRAVGIDYVQSLTAPTADKTLPGIAPLAQAGPITITVNN